MRKKIFLHVGMHKTGTTAIQVFCSKHARRLSELGYLYPAAGRPCVEDVSYGHHLLPWSLTGHITDRMFWPEGMLNFEAVWDRLSDEIDASDCRSAVLSSEEFDTLHPSHVHAVFEKLRAFEVQPIIYLRRLDELLQAMYTTDVIHNSEREDIVAFQRKLRTPLDYEALIAPWLQHSSCTPVVRFYDPALARAGIVNDMLGLLEIERSSFGEGETAERVNVGNWPWYVIEVCRKMNACDLPARSVVIKFAYTMRDVVGHSGGYDLIAPSHAAHLKQHGFQALQRLSERSVVSELIPPHFREVIARSDDAHWLAVRGEEHGAIVRVLQQISRLVSLKAAATSTPLRPEGEAHRGSEPEP